MKAKVLVKFRDKNNGTIYNAGDVITVSEKRFKEILKVGKLVEEVAEEVTEAAEPKKNTRKSARKSAE